MYPRKPHQDNDFEKLYERARSSCWHRAKHAFVDPRVLMHLITVHKNFLELRSLVERHWERAQEEQGVGGHSDRDLFLWAQALKWFEQEDDRHEDDQFGI